MEMRLSFLLQAVVKKQKKTWHTVAASGEGREVQALAPASRGSRASSKPPVRVEAGAFPAWGGAAGAAMEKKTRPALPAPSVHELAK